MNQCTAKHLADYAVFGNMDSPAEFFAQNSPRAQSLCLLRAIEAVATHLLSIGDAKGAREALSLTRRGTYGADNHHRWASEIRPHEAARLMTSLSEIDKASRATISAQ